jgi:hypothetical protein
MFKKIKTMLKPTKLKEKSKLSEEILLQETFMKLMLLSILLVISFKEELKFLMFKELLNKLIKTMKKMLLP